MPKVILEFNLPEEKSEFNRTVNADKMAHILNEFREWARHRLKHGSDNEKTLEYSPGIGQALDTLFEIAGEHGVDLHELWE